MARETPTQRYPALAIAEVMRQKRVASEAELRAHLAPQIGLEKYLEVMEKLKTVSYLRQEGDTLRWVE